MGLQWHDVPKIHPAMAAFLLAHALYSVYGNFVPSHVARTEFVSSSLVVPLEFSRDHRLGDTR